MVCVGVGAPRQHLANVSANCQEISQQIDEASELGLELLLFPELCLTGYSCGDLFGQTALQTAAREGLCELAAKTADPETPIVVVGLPLAVGSHLFNTAAVLGGGSILGLVPKQFLPNYKEFYERRWFTPALGAIPTSVRLPELPDQEIPFGVDLLFQAQQVPDCILGVELCEDLWAPIPPSALQALAGATLLLNLSGSNEGIGKADYRRDLVVGQSARCLAAYAYAGAGVTESTTDLVFGGHLLIAEAGWLLAENDRFQRNSEILWANIDIERLQLDRQRLSAFSDNALRHHLPGNQFRLIPFSLPNFLPSEFQLALTQPNENSQLTTCEWVVGRPVPAYPFVPSDPTSLQERCEEIFQIQMAGLAGRLEAAQPPLLSIGVSGGLDSTLALLVATKTLDLLQWDRKRLHAFTMPGFGTSARTYQNACRLMQLLGVEQKQVDIRPLALQTFADLNYVPFGPEFQAIWQRVRQQWHQYLLETPDTENPVTWPDNLWQPLQAAWAELPAEMLSDLVFENVQARLRTMLLMCNGFVIGTGDLSELALGWATYNADHMSMYNPNVSIPKTLVRFLVRWVADNEFEGEIRTVLHSVAETEISPELLPLRPDGTVQSTEATIGPYELHDFFLYHLLRFGYRPSKILFLATQAEFSRVYSQQELKKWLTVFCRRFFAQQYKRSCLPDGPKVGSITLSPRGDWRMPSDAQVQTWLEDLERLVIND